MHQRKEEDKGPGQTAGDPPPEKVSPEDEFVFPDWDNPEDRDDGAPEGYYDEDDEEYDDDEDDEDDGYIPEPGDPDYDLSEAAGYVGYDPPSHEGPVPQWAITAGAVLLILAIVIPVILAIR